MTYLSPHQIYRLLTYLIGTSIVAAAVHFPFRESVYVRGPVGALGLMCAWLATGTAFWTCIRLRERKFCRGLLISLIPLAYWLWQLYEAVHGRYV